MEKRKLKMRVEEHGETIVLRPEGPCGRDCIDALEQFIRNADSKSSKHIVFDASGLDYIDSPGFRWLVDRSREVHDGGGSFTVVGLAGSAERAFRLLRLDQFIPSAPSVEVAIARQKRRHGISR